MKILLLDIDETVYPKDHGPIVLVNKRIESFVMSCCNLSQDEAQALRRKYATRYGFTMGGLMRHYGVDPHKYLGDVHDVPIEDLLEPDPRLRYVLSELPNEVIAFSNAPREYVMRVINTLGVADLFSDLFTIEFMDFVPKPYPYPYRKVLQQYARLADECVVVDNHPANIRTAIDLGMKGVLVGSDEGTDAFFAIPDIYAITRILDEVV